MTVLTETCETCAFWSRQTSREGACHRHAPQPNLRHQEATHWAETHGSQSCGEWSASGERALPTCADCRYWRRPALGLNPMNRSDMRAGWWEGAGICARWAPGAIGEPGARAFWSATHGLDFCGDGAALPVPKG